MSGLVVALALIPEAISFSIIAGVDPRVGLSASFSIPSPLVAIVVLATAAITMGWKLPTVGDMGELPDRTSGSVSTH